MKVTALGRNFAKNVAPHNGANVIFLYTKTRIILDTAIWIDLIR